MSHVTRREILKTAASAVLVSPVIGAASSASAVASPQTAAVTPNPFGRRGIGAAPTGFSARMRANAAMTPPVDFLDYCHNLGLGGAELRLPPTDPAEIAKLRARAESYNMRVIFDISSRLPQTADLQTFETIVKAAKEIGATGIHGALTQRRYEQFDTFEAFKASFEKNKADVARAEPIMRKYKIPLVLENHKGWRAAEQAAWLKNLGSEYVGVHFDFGNNVSLCEDPMQTLDTLLPYTKSCHIKDMAVEMYDDGFLLSEVPLGEGFLDLKAMVAKLRQKDPDMGFDLEMITRDPLKIPVFTDKYWVTFDDTYSPFPARDLARILEIVKRNPPKQPLPKTTGLSADQRLKLEDDDNLRSIQWARANLQM
ncbi:MAG TPA: TIM barrel protein [Vicinamibacterales bacterium]|nr:TIM barrel protein [Vicinamibacterales bacterium]